MPQVVYLLCTFTSLACAILVGRAYRSSRVPLLFWSVICFAALTLSNVLLFVDLVMIPDVDLRPLRNAVMLLGVVAMLYGLINTEN